MNSKWISVDDALPEKGTKVLAWCKHIGQTTAFYWGPEREDKIPHPLTKGWCLMDITHWQPLPDDPEGAILLTGKKK